jgi:hypothetical protein
MLNWELDTIWAGLDKHAWSEFDLSEGLRAMIGGMFSDVVWRRLPPK